MTSNGGTQLKAVSFDLARHGMFAQGQEVSCACRADP